MLPRSVIQKALEVVFIDTYGSAAIGQGLYIRQGNCMGLTDSITFVLLIVWSDEVLIAELRYNYKTNDSAETGGKAVLDLKTSQADTIGNKKVDSLFIVMGPGNQASVVDPGLCGTGSHNRLRDVAQIKQE